jgi:hypothetical protein
MRRQPHPACGHPLQMEERNLERERQAPLPPSPNWCRSTAQAPFGEGRGEAVLRMAAFSRQARHAMIHSRGLISAWRAAPRHLLQASEPQASIASPCTTRCRDAFVPAALALKNAGPFLFEDLRRQRHKV